MKRYFISNRNGKKWPANHPNHTNAILFNSRHSSDLRAKISVELFCLQSLVSLIALAVAGCGKQPVGMPATPAPEIKNGHPVVHLPPVETRPFEDGYNAGYEYGRKQAVPHGKLPTDDEAADVARRWAVGQPDRWERGFAEGYADGMRKVVTGQK
jgi:hypothetical protein